MSAVKNSRRQASVSASLRCYEVDVWVADGFTFQTEASLSEPAAQEDDIFRSIAKAVARVNQFVSPSAACMLKAVADSSLPDNDRLHRLTST